MDKAMRYSLDIGVGPSATGVFIAALMNCQKVIPATFHKELPYHVGHSIMSRFVILTE